MSWLDRRVVSYMPLSIFRALDSGAGARPILKRWRLGMTVEPDPPPLSDDPLPLDVGVSVFEPRLGVSQVPWRRRRIDADEPGDVVAEIAFELLFRDAEALRRLVAEHFKLTQPHARIVRRRIGAEDDLLLAQLLGEFDDARLEAPAGFAIDVRRVHRHPERLEGIVAAGLNAEMPDDEIDHRELADDRIEHRRDRVGPIAGVDEDDDAEFGAFLHRGPQPVERAIGPVTVHVGVQLQHFEAVFLDMELELRRAVFQAPARIVVEVADEPVGVLPTELGAISHVFANAFAPHAVAGAGAGVAGGRLDEAHIDAA